MKRLQYHTVFWGAFYFLIAMSQAETLLVDVPESMLEQEMLQAQSRLSSMSHGYYPREDWDRLFDQFSQLAERAQKAGRDDLVVQLSLNQATVQSQALEEKLESAELLKNTLVRYHGSSNPSLRRIYVQLAELYADMGDEAAVVRLIEEYRKSDLNEAVPLAYRGGAKAGDPLEITRPHGHGEESLTLTAMENSRRKALLASGRLAADFTSESAKGKTICLRDYRGAVVLLDFYHPQWPGWSETLPKIKKIYKRFHARGFEIIGIPLRSEGIKKPGVPWILLRSSKGIAEPYRVFGDATNFLIDQDGRIAGKNLAAEDIEMQLSELLKPEL